VLHGVNKYGTKLLLLILLYSIPSLFIDALVQQQIYQIQSQHKYTKIKEKIIQIIIIIIIIT